MLRSLFPHTNTLLVCVGLTPSRNSRLVRKPTEEAIRPELTGSWAHELCYWASPETDNQMRGTRLEGVEAAVAHYNVPAASQTQLDASKWEYTASGVVTNWLLCLFVLQDTFKSKLREFGKRRTFSKTWRKLEERLKEAFPPFLCYTLALALMTLREITFLSPCFLFQSSPILCLALHHPSCQCRPVAPVSTAHSDALYPSIQQSVSLTLVLLSFHCRRMFTALWDVEDLCLPTVSQYILSFGNQNVYRYQMSKGGRQKIAPV